MRLKLVLFLFTSFLLNSFLYSQTIISYKLDWKTTNKGATFLYYNTTESIHPDKIPYLIHQIKINQNKEVSFSFTIEKERTLSQKELSASNVIKENIGELAPSKTIYKNARKNRFAILELQPIYKKNNKLYLIEEVTINHSLTNSSSLTSANRTNGNFASSSVLAVNDFYKIAITRDGVYQLTYNNLKDAGILSASVSSNSINIYGNHNGMLPEHNSVFRHDDLNKNAIQVFDNNDGTFDDGDYILFYAEEANKWKFNSASNLFNYEQHLYSKESFVFLTINDNSGAKRTPSTNKNSSPATNTMITFNDFKGREIESVNLMQTANRGGSGKQWVGEIFDIQLGYNFNFNFPNINPTEIVTTKVNLLANTPGSGSSNFSINAGSASDNISVPGIPVGAHSNIALERNSTLTFNSASNNIPVSISFTKAPSGKSTGWLDYIEVNATRNLIMNGSQMAFRDINSVGTGNITEFTLSGANSVSQIWDVTDPSNVLNLNFDDNTSTKSFTFESDSLRTFIAFRNGNFLNPKIVGPVEKQNLHAQVPSDMIIVYHPLFKSQVDKLANFHQSKGLTVVKASTVEIYNEFSSGMQDISAIKTYAKMLYDRGGSNPPKYLLLFGDGSYDYKARVTPNQNFVPVWESPASLNDLSSFTTDDFFGILDDNEGIGNSDRMDVSVGRLTVKTPGEAEVVVNKIINYQKDGVSLEELQTCNTASSGNAYGDWRNVLAFVSDDVDDNWEFAFFRHSEKIMDSIRNRQPLFNIDKIHMDAFKQESTPGGERYFNGAEAIRRRVENGALILAYEGHGGETGWAHERILDLATINGWTNYNKLPIFLTATCEFTKYDDPSRVSAGEQLLLSETGGSIGLFTTTRAVFQSANERLIEAFFEEAFIKKADGSPRTLGDIYLETKNHPLVIGNSNSRKFGLIGDPALQLAFPKHKVVTQTINGAPVGSGADTLKALSKITITGSVTDQSGALLSNYNGFVYPTVLDKSKTISTLGNFSPSFIADFDIQKSQLYKGKATVTNGQFSYTFIVPKDINYTFGNGKLSYYAFNGIEDATGVEENIVIGGTNNSLIQDNEGPQIKLFLNNENFVSGGITDEEPNLYAELFDSNGINTTGNGIGHDITAIIDENTNQAIVLNNNYESDADTYQSGKITFPLSRLAEGNHTLTLKAWDVHNNSNSETIDFVVVNKEELAIDHVLNYPNPFTTRTQFFFEHNQTCEFLEAQVQIFTVSGKLVKTINRMVKTHGFRVDPIEWDGKDDFGDNIGKGTYVYRVKVTDNENNKVEKFEKLVILK